MDESARVLVDSSVWIDFFRGNPAAAKAFEKLQKEMSIWPCEAEIPADFIEAARISAALRWKGITIPPGDCLIAALAKRLNLQIHTHDPDFDSIPTPLKYRT